jgi:hypothetical protein
MKRRDFLKKSVQTTAAGCALNSVGSANAFFNVGLMPKASTTNGYVINHAALFNGSNGRLTRTPSSASNRSTWTWSMWIKMSHLKTTIELFSAGTTTPNRELVYHLGDNDSGGVKASCFHYENSASGSYVDQVDLSTGYRDQSSWYHFVFVKDTTEATDTDRLRFYVNGVRDQNFVNSNFPTLNAVSYINNTTTHEIGASINAAFFNGYMAEIHFVDGQALSPSDFAEIDTKTNEWVPKMFEGTYGTNGFHLNFSNSGNLGEDSSGNNNHWTVNGGINQVTDVPTDSIAQELSNFATWDTYHNRTSYQATYSNGNQITYGGHSKVLMCTSTLGTDGKGVFYAEFEVSTSTSASGVGAAPRRYKSVNTPYAYQYGGSHYITSTGTIHSPVLDISASSYSGSVRIGVIIDHVNEELRYYRDGILVGTITEATHGIDSLGDGQYWFFQGHAQDTASNYITSYFNPADWTQTPTGISAKNALCTANLAAVSGSLDSEFKTILYTGNGTAIGSGGLQVTGLGFQPDFVWIKSRSGVKNHMLFDSVRGPENFIKTNNVDAEDTSSETLSSFDSDGFTLGADTSINNSSENYVAWCWRLPETLSGATQGAGTTKTFEWKYNSKLGIAVGRYIGNGIDGHEIPLPPINGKAPFMVHVKNLTDAVNWKGTHETVGWTHTFWMNKIDAATPNAGLFYDTPPTDTTLTLGASNNGNDLDDQIWVLAYWETDYTKSITYTGNGNSEGPISYLHGTPEYAFFKRTDSTGEWVVQDQQRLGRNFGEQRSLSFCQNVIENDGTYLGSATAGNVVDFLSTQIKHNSTNGNANNSGNTYIGAAHVHPIGRKGTSQKRGK